VNLEQTLTDELASVAGSIGVPPPPAVAAVVQRAEQSRTRSRVRWTATTLLAAAAVVAAVVVGNQIGRPDAAPSPAPQPTRSPTGLPTGAPPRVAYVAGSRLYLDGRVVPGDWGGVDVVGGTTLGYVHDPHDQTTTRVVFRDGREVGRITDVSVDQPSLLSRDGTKLAWVERAGGRYFLVVRDVPGWRELGRLEVDPSRLGHVGAEDEGWETLTAVADDGTVSYGGVVAAHTWKPGSAPVDQAPQPSLESNDFPRSSGGVVISPDGTWGAWSTDRHGKVTVDADQKADGVTLAHPRRPASQFTLALPPGTDGRMLTWESTTDLLVTVFDDPDGVRWHFLRCDVVTRRCELAPTPGSR
jgi:hypothetical protein